MEPMRSGPWKAKARKWAEATDPGWTACFSSLRMADGTTTGRAGAICGEEGSFFGEFSDRFYAWAERAEQACNWFWGSLYLVGVVVGTSLHHRHSHSLLDALATNATRPELSPPFLARLLTMSPAITPARP